MAAQYIQLKQGWNVLIYYNVDEYDYVEIEDSLMQLDCPTQDIDRAFEVLTKRNTGFTFSNTDYRMSVVCISRATNIEQFVNTAIHEAKHVQSHICSYYEIDEDSETAAYLMGYLVQRMYRYFAKLVKRYV